MGGGGILEGETRPDMVAEFAALRPAGDIGNGVLEPALPFYRLAYANVTVRPVLVFGMPEEAKSRAIADITRWAESGALSHHIGPRFALEDTAAAHSAVEGGAFGKVIVEIAAL